MIAKFSVPLPGVEKWQISSPGGAKFKPGVSGNPGGRPKALVSVVALAREHTRASIDTLKKITTDQKASASARVSAAVALLERGWGKAPQSISLRQEEGRQISDADLLAIIGADEDDQPAASMVQ